MRVVELFNFRTVMIVADAFFKLPQRRIAMSSEESTSRSSVHSHCPVQQVPAKEHSLPHSAVQVQVATGTSTSASENQDDPPSAAPKRVTDTVVKVPPPRH